MNMEINNIGVLIRRERTRCRMTQEKLGERVGVGVLAGGGSRRPGLIGYIVANIGEFARTHGMTVREAGNYLNRYKGLDFLAEHYEAEHLSATAYRI